MNKMLEEGVRQIVREEMNRRQRKEDYETAAEDYINPRYEMENRKAAQEFLDETRKARKWSNFETDMLIARFSEFCCDRAIKTGRSFASVSCKIRNLMQEGYIKTW